MKRTLSIVLLAALAMTACTSTERAAYNTVVAAKALLNSEKSAHPECTAASNNSALCVDLRKATDAKDLLVDAIEVYCGGAQFEAGGACQAPAKGTPRATQLIAKLKAALSSYSQTEKDLKAVIK
jgi:protein involved in sex pheromone biosynthesis